MDTVLVRKAASLERCIARVRDKYIGHEAELDADIDLQDRRAQPAACVSARDRHGSPDRSDAPAGAACRHRRDVPDSGTGRPDHRDLSESLKRMVGFRNVTVHGYQELDLAKVRVIIETRLVDLATFAKAMLAADPSG